MPSVNYTAPTNSILRALPDRDCRRLYAHHDQVKFNYGDILGEPGKQLRYVYFPNSGVISLLTPVQGHASVEVGLVGRDGMAGLALFLGVGASPVRMLVQGTGGGLRIKAAAFRHEIKRNAALCRELNRYLYAFMVQVGQTAGCNCFHQIGARLARWLLMMHDRIASDEFLLTQEFLAHMLGVRRVGITLAARILQKQKLIHYSRGKIAILNRRGLERAACECYRAVNNISRYA